MRSVERLRLLLVLAALGVAGCGGGSSTVTTVTGGGLSGGAVGPVVTLDAPSGPNTTEVVVDAGPDSGFSLGAANLPYVSITVCRPGSDTACVTLDHVFLDTGSVGLRLLGSGVASIGLPTLTLPADAAHGTPAGDAAQCYPFVLGAVWGPLATADLRIGGEVARGLPVQLIDDDPSPRHAPPPQCGDAAGGGLLNSVAALQARAILGVGMVRLDCGLACVTADYAGSQPLYYVCPPGGACVPAAMPAAQQVQNPVSFFPEDNNGTLLVLPAIPDTGASVVKGRLVFGIGTQPNNQIPLQATMLRVNADPASAQYLYLATTSAGLVFADSYLDTGSNALFFEDPSIPKGCRSSSGGSGGWYCPPQVLHRSAVLQGMGGVQASVAFTLASADLLFSASNAAFSDLGGSAGQDPAAFVWGMPFFYGRSVYTSIWGQALSPDGPWVAF